MQKKLMKQWWHWNFEISNEYAKRENYQTKQDNSWAKKWNGIIKEKTFKKN